MNFYYDPILGLQLTLGTSFFVLDLDAIPKNYTAKDFLQIISQKGIAFIDCGEKLGGVDVVANITSHQL